MTSEPPPNARYCPTCGTRVSQDADHCIVCRTELVPGVSGPAPKVARKWRPPESFIHLPVILGIVLLLVMAAVTGVFLTRQPLGTPLAAVLTPGATDTMTPPPLLPTEIAPTDTLIPTATVIPDTATPFVSPTPDTGMVPSGARLRLSKGPVSLSALSPDEQELIVGSWFTLCSYQVGKSSQSTASPPGEGWCRTTGEDSTASIGALATSPDGKTFLSGLYNGSIILWDSATGKQIWKIPSDLPVYSLSWSPDGHRFASAHQGGSIVVWYALDGSQVSTLQARGLPTNNVIRWSPDGKLIAAGDGTGLVTLWDAQSGQMVSTYRIAPEGYSITNLAWTPDSSLILTNAYGPWCEGNCTPTEKGRIALFDARSGEQKWQIDAGDWVYGLTISPDGTQFLTVVGADAFKRFRMSDGALIQSLPAADPAGDFWLKDGKHLLLLDRTGNLVKRDLATAQQTAVHLGDYYAISSLAWSPDGGQLATGSWGAPAVIWDRISGKILRTIGPAQSDGPIAWSPDGTEIATSHGNQAFIWDAQTGSQRQVLTGSGASAAYMSWSPDGRLFATLFDASLSPGASLMCSLTLYETDTWTIVHVIQYWESGNYIAFAWSPDGKTLATNGDSVDLWDVASGDFIGTVIDGSEFGNLQWSPDGSSLLVNDGIYDIARKALPVSLSGYVSVFSPDGMLLATADDHIEFRSPLKGILLMTLEGSAGSPQSLVFSPDGRTLASLSGGTVILWDVPTFPSPTATPGGTTTPPATPTPFTGMVPPGAYLRLSKGSASMVSLAPDGQNVIIGSLITLCSYRLADTIDHPTSPLAETWCRTPGDAPNSMMHILLASPDGKSLLTGLDNDSVVLWDTVSGTQKWTDPYVRSLMAITWSPDNQKVAGIFDDGYLIVWDARDGSVLERIQTGNTPGVLQWSPDGKSIAGGGGSYSPVTVWDVDTGQVTFSHHFFPEMHGATALAWSADSSSILAGSSYVSCYEMCTPTYDGQMILFDAHTGDVKWQVDAGDQVHSLALNPDGTQVLARVGSDTFKLYRISDRGLIRSFLVKGLVGAFWLPDGKRLLSLDGSANLSVWDLTGVQRATTHLDGYYDLANLAWSPDSSELAASSWSGPVTIWDRSSGKLLRTLDTGDMGYAVAWSPDGKEIATQGNHQVTIWDTRSGSILHTLTDSGNSYDLGWSPDGSLFASMTGDGKVGSGDFTRYITLWDAHTWEVIRVIRHSENGYYGAGTLAWSPDGKTLAADGDGIYLWDVTSGEFITTLDFNTFYTGLQWTPDGARLLTNTGIIWDVNSQTILVHVNGDNSLGWPDSATISPDGKLLATGEDHIVLRSPVDGSVLQTLAGAANHPWHLVFSPDGKTLASLSSEGTVVLWIVPVIASPAVTP